MAPHQPLMRLLARLAMAMSHPHLLRLCQPYQRLSLLFHPVLTLLPWWRKQYRPQWPQLRSLPRPLRPSVPRRQSCPLLPRLCQRLCPPWHRPRQRPWTWTTTASFHVSNCYSSVQGDADSHANSGAALCAPRTDDCNTVKLCPIAPLETEWPTAADSLDMVFDATLHGVPCRVLMDTGAAFSFADADWLASHGFTLQPDQPITVVTATSQRVTVHGVFRGELRLARVKTPVRLRSLPGLMPGVQVVLGGDLKNLYHLPCKAAASCL